MNESDIDIGSLTIQQWQPSTLTIIVGEGKVIISLKNGSVTFDNCEPDESAKKFWDAVTRMFPGSAGK